MRIANAPAAPLSPSRKIQLSGDKKFRSRADFFNATAHGAEKSKGGPCGKNTKQLPNQKNFQPSKT
jgi:hypothetical protein